MKLLYHIYVFGLKKGIFGCGLGGTRHFIG